MPIRLNLLAEAHELEELRRKDPVKRALTIACAVIGLVLVWCASKQVLVFADQRQLSDMEGQIKQRTGEYEKVATIQKQLNEVQAKLTALHQLATNRLLYGSVLNSLQQVAGEDIQLTQMRVDQSYSSVEATKPRKNETTGRTIPGTPAASVERITITLDARDTSLRPGEEQVNKWRQSLGDSVLFRDMLGKTNEFRLTSRSAPKTSPGSDKPFVTFTLEARIPERAR